MIREIIELLYPWATKEQTQEAVDIFNRRSDEYLYSFTETEADAHSAETAELIQAYFVDQTKPELPDLTL